MKAFGAKDQGMQEYLADHERFADLINGTVFAGKQIIEAQYLKEVQRKKRVSVADTADLVNLQKKNSSSQNGTKRIYLERERDFLRLYDKPGCRFLIACEVESSADYEMPVRCLTYDGVEYTNQLKARKQKDDSEKTHERQPLIPVFHLVVYLGEKRWISKQHLQEMMKIPEEVKKFSGQLPEYDIGLVDIHEQNPDLFHTEWKEIFKIMNHSRKKEELRKYIEDHKEEIQKLSVETRWFLGILLEQYTIVDERVMEVKEMCEAWDGAVKLQAQIEGRVIAQELAPKMAEEMAPKMAEEMAAKIAKDMAADMAPKMAEEMAGEMAEEIVEKRLKEHKQRLKRKEKERNKKVVYNMFAKGYPQEEISEVLNLPFSKVKKWCKNFSKDAAVEMA